MSAPWNNASWPWSQNSLISTHIRVHDSNGKPLEDGLLYTYFSGTQEPAPVFWVGDGYGAYDWPLQLDWTGSATFYMPTAYVPYRYNVTDANGVQQDNFPIDNVLPDTLVVPPVPTIVVGWWDYNGGAGGVFTQSQQNTAYSPGPYGPDQPVYWSTSDQGELVMALFPVSPSWYPVPPQTGTIYAEDGSTVLASGVDVSNLFTTYGFFDPNAMTDGLGVIPYYSQPTGWNGIYQYTGLEGGTPGYIDLNMEVTDADSNLHTFPFRFRLPYLEVGHWEDTLWVPQPCGTGHSPGPRGAENSNAFWDEYMFNSDGSMMNGAQPRYMVYDWEIKSEWIYLYFNNNGWTPQPGGADASTLMRVLAGGSPAPNSLFLSPHPLMDPAPLYLALDPDHAPGSGAWFEYTLVLYLDPNYSITAEIPFRHSLPSW